MARETDPKIYTRRGDDGGTGLFDGTRVSKADPRVEAYGDVDELASWIGVARAGLSDPRLVDTLRQIQRDLFALGARLADPGDRIAPRVDKAQLGEADVRRLEDWIDGFEADLPPLRRFILAGGSEPGARLHLARAVCRRAERRVTSLLPDLNPVRLAYLNRLSDLLFVMARTANAASGAAEDPW